MKLKAPFPYFGGKSSIADVIWAALGQPRHYIERPFYDMRMSPEDAFKAIRKVAK